MVSTSELYFAVWSALIVDERVVVAWDIKSYSGQRFSCVAPRMERFPLDRPRAVKIRCSLEVDYGGVWNLWLQAKIFLTL